jgi:hypothetical protein
MLVWDMQNDTTPEAARMRLDALRSISGVARLNQALDLSDAVRAISEAGHRARELEARTHASPHPGDEAH